ncbi:PEBP-like protein, partial [Cryphonectria parasitica EP155]
LINQVIDDFLPSLLVEAEWPSKNTYSNLGNTLKPKNLQDQPSITLTSSPPSSSSSSESPTTCFSTNTTYVLALTDPDAPSRDNPKWSEFCHWIATGLTVSSSSSAAADADLMPYKPPGPPEKTGKHRYVFLVFVPANGTSEPLDLSKPGDRQHWGFEFEGGRVGVRRWAQENGLVPIAANFIYAQNKKQ